VVQFGPRLITSCDRANRVMRPATDVLADGVDRPAQMAYMTVTKAHEKNCCRTRPILSASGMPM
jgi:hypothetical protein